MAIFNYIWLSKGILKNIKNDSIDNIFYLIKKHILKKEISKKNKIFYIIYQVIKKNLSY